MNEAGLSHEVEQADALTKFESQLFSPAIAIVLGGIGFTLIALTLLIVAIAKGTAQ